MGSDVGDVLPSAWERRALTDVLAYREGPGILARDFRDSGVPLIRLKGLEVGNALSEGCNFLDSRMVAERWSHFAVEPGDTLLSTSATLGRVKVVQRNDAGGVPYTGIIRFRVLDAADVAPEFVRYILEAPDFQRQVQAMGVGSVIRHFGPMHLRQMTVVVPPLAEQRRIAAVLGALDDKIELNRKMNRTLEGMAQAIFKSWFIDFDGHEDLVDSEFGLIPRGWTTASVYESARVVYGAPFASEQFNSEGVGLPLIRNRDLKTNAPAVWTAENHRNGHIIEPGDIVVSMDAEFRPYIWQGPRAWLNQRVCHFEALPGVPRGFVYFAIRNPLAAWERATVGTTVIHLGKANIDRILLVMPPSDRLAEFAHVVEPMLDRVVATAAESRTLAELRDTLLPKLISGEIRVPEAEELAEAAT